MKKWILISAFSFLSCAGFSQDTLEVADLAQLHEAAKNQNVPVETFDRLSGKMRYFDSHPVSKDQQPVLLDTYRAIAAGYTSNNHFKQAYVVYQKLLSLKEKFLAEEKSGAIAAACSHINEIQKKDEDELMRVQNEIQQLQMDTDYLQSKRQSFKKYFSFIIVALTVLFAFLLLQASLRLSRIRSELNAGRERLKTIHRMATLGQLRSGIRSTFQSSAASIRKLAEEASAQAEQIGQGEKNNDLVNLKKQLGELKKIS